MFGLLASTRVSEPALQVFAVKTRDYIRAPYMLGSAICKRLRQLLKNQTDMAQAD